MDYQLHADLKQLIQGAVLTDATDRRRFRHDASIYELTPEAIIQPYNSQDIQNIVRFISDNKAHYPRLSLTPRGAGTDMSGGALSGSLLLDMTAHFTSVESYEKHLLHVQPGVYLRSIEPLLHAAGQQIGSTPASRAYATIGGIVGNNAGGEQSLRYGNTNRWVRALKVVLADGNEYTIKPLTKRQLDKKRAEDTYEGRLYNGVYELIEAHYEAIKTARPMVNKNSMGYALWDVWDRETGIFDLTHLFTGSQGTLGVITDVWLETVPKPQHEGLLLIYLPSLRHLGAVIETTLQHHPAALEGFDDLTFSLGVKHFKTFRRQLGTKEWAKQQAALLTSVAKLKGNTPHIILMVSFDGTSPQDVKKKQQRLQEDLLRYKVRTESEDDPHSHAAFWNIRRSALALLKTQLKDRYAAPFIDDLTIQPRFVSDFLPKLRKIIRKYKLPVTIHGHFGDGNFHLLPLMDIAGTKEQAKLEPVLRELLPIILSYGGTLAGEHNDGMVRGPWLPAVFGQEMFRLFREVKELFDPQYIFNPHKKTDASWEYSMSHIRTTTVSHLPK